MMAVVLSLGEARMQATRPDEPFHVWFTPSGTAWTAFFRSTDGYLLRFPGVADFEVSKDGTAVRGHPVVGAEPPTVQHMFQNQVQPLALSLQGQLVLHGSAVDLGGYAVGFVGPTGRGKSTLAASFARRGWPFLSDDALHIEWSEAGPSVRPAHPCFRLWADSEMALVPEGASPAPPLAFTAKNCFSAGPEFPFGAQPSPLRCLYFLGPGEASQPRFQSLRPGAAVAEMVKHSFLLDISGPDALAWHFDELSRLARLPLHYLLDFPRHYGDLADVQDAIVRHAASLPSNP